MDVGVSLCTKRYIIIEGIRAMLAVSWFIAELAMPTLVSVVVSITISSADYARPLRPWAVDTIGTALMIGVPNNTDQTGSPLLNLLAGH